MKQSKKTKLPLSVQTVRSLTEQVLENVAGGTIYTWTVPSGTRNKCETGLCTG